MAKNSSRNKQNSRRSFLAAATGAIGTGSVVEVLSGQVPAPALPDETTIALVNGRIHSMGASDTVIETVSIRNGRFVAVGGSAPAARAGVRVIDLRGRTVVPGLVEPHIH